MGLTWGVRSSHLTLKRQKAAETKGRPHVSNLGPTIRDYQRAAAALSQDSLRTSIECHLEVLDEVIGELFSIDPKTGDPSELSCANWDVILEALAVAVYVRELVTRPVKPFTWVRLSSN
jgi:hypothetical protein